MRGFFALLKCCRYTRRMDTDLLNFDDAPPDLSDLLKPGDMDDLMTMPDLADLIAAAELIDLDELMIWLALFPAPAAA